MKNYIFNAIKDQTKIRQLHHFFDIGNSISYKPNFLPVYLCADT